PAAQEPGMTPEDRGLPDLGVGGMVGRPVYLAVIQQDIAVRRGIVAPEVGGNPLCAERVRSLRDLRVSLGDALLRAGVVGNPIAAKPAVALIDDNLPARDDLVA